jgi:nicotinate-nucleotide--dimethylbenzimidazole phosphoribosyltransferase
VQSRMTVMVDGFISGVAALAAVMMDPGTAEAVLLSHRSSEAGAQVLLAALRRCGVRLPAALDMQMRLGEGTGALLCVPMLSAACAVMRDMGTLQQTLALVGDPAVGSGQEGGAASTLWGPVPHDE